MSERKSSIVVFELAVISSTCTAVVILHLRHVNWRSACALFKLWWIAWSNNCWMVPPQPANELARISANDSQRPNKPSKSTSACCGRNETCVMAPDYELSTSKFPTSCDPTVLTVSELFQQRSGLLIGLTIIHNGPSQMPPSPEKWTLPLDEVNIGILLSPAERHLRM